MRGQAPKPPPLGRPTAPGRRHRGSTRSINNPERLRSDSAVFPGPASRGRLPSSHPVQVEGRWAPTAALPRGQGCPCAPAAWEHGGGESFGHSPSLVTAGDCRVSIPSGQGLGVLSIDPLHCSVSGESLHAHTGTPSPLGSPPTLILRRSGMSAAWALREPLGSGAGRLRGCGRSGKPQCH